MTRAQPSDANIGRLIRSIGDHFAVCVDDVQHILKIKPRQAWYYIHRLQDEGVIYLRYRENRRKYYSLRTKDEVRPTS
jgi:hypothetical protein